MTVAQAAKLKGVTRAAIYGAVARGRLPHKRILGHIALREADVLAWVPLGHKTGRAKGTPMSPEAKLRLSESQKKRWAQRKSQGTNKK
ncbi:MAG: helix-turn-helix domain-containing protein [Abitibacteriaceae bacterium]|nr:helix-turn-helix domain-containing protein [Abditibacteriaceae bacterium]